MLKNLKMNDFSSKLNFFIKDSEWIFAKTYAKTWPHEYIVQENVDNNLFIDLAKHITRYGYESDFYDSKETYFDYKGNTYWHMGNIINRCPVSETYRSRKKEGRLPEE